MDKTEITKIVEKELLDFFDAKTLLRHNKEIMEFSIEATLKAINYTRCSTQFVCEHRWVHNTHSDTKYCSKGCDGFKIHEAN